MHPIITITWYDLLRAFKQRETFVFGLLMPAVMMLLLGIATGGSEDGPTITVDVIDEDGSALSAALLDALRAETATDRAFRVCLIGADVSASGCTVSAAPDQRRQVADRRLKDTDSYGTLLILTGFGAGLRAGDPVTLLYKSSADLNAPLLAEQKIDAALSRLGGAVAIANLTVNVAGDTFQPQGAPEWDRAAAFDQVRGAVEKAWATRPIRVESQGTVARPSRAGFNQSGPGMAIMFVLIMMLNSSTVLIYEREVGTLQRLFVLPVPRWQTLAGKIVGRYLYGLAIFAMLVLAGTAMGVEWGDNAAGIVLIMLAYTLTVTALGLALSTVARTSAQASNLSLLFAMTLSPLGGAWWPLEIVPDLMKLIGHLTPVAWAIDAFGELMFYGGTLADIAPMLGVLLGMAALFFAFGVWRFRYE